MTPKNKCVTLDGIMKKGIAYKPRQCKYCKNGVYIEENGKVIPTYIYPYCPKCGRSLETISNLEGESNAD